MTVRVLLDDAPAPYRRSRMRWVEYLFLFVGLIALDYYVWVNASAALSQAYESWSFSQELRGQPATVRGFIQDEIALLGRAPSESAAEKRPPAGIAPGQRNIPTPILPPAPLSVIGRIEIPRLHLNVMVREGVTSTALRSAVGHVPSTSLPGQVGNVALAGHRDTFFRPLQDIRKDDRITVQTLNGSYEYVVDSLRVVSPKDVWVLHASNQNALTLVTCYPFHYVGAAPQRFIVHAMQIAAPDGPRAVGSD